MSESRSYCALVMLLRCTKLASFIEACYKVPRVFTCIRWKALAGVLVGGKISVFSVPICNLTRSAFGTAFLCINEPLCFHRLVFSQEIVQDGSLRPLSLV